MLKKNYIAAVTTLIGGTLGAGLFGVPYVFSQAGVLTATLWTVAMGILLIVLNLLHAEISLSVPGNHSFVGLIQHLLPKRYSHIAIFTTCLQFFIALFAYVTLFTGFLNALLPASRAQLPAVGATIYSIAIGRFIFSGVSNIKKYNKLIVITFVTLLLFIIALAVPSIQSIHIFSPAITKRFIPYGVLLYTLNGASSIPIIQDCLGTDKKKLPHIIIAGGVICMVLVLARGWTVAGITGMVTSQDAISGLSTHLGARIVRLGGLVGILAIVSPHLIIGEHLIETLKDYFRISHLSARALTILLPLLTFLYIGGGFINTIGFAGAVFIGVMGVFVGVMNLVLHYKHGKKEVHILSHNKFRSYLMICVFSLGILYGLAKEFFL